MVRMIFYDFGALPSVIKSFSFLPSRRACLLFLGENTLFFVASCVIIKIKHVYVSSNLAELGYSCVLSKQNNFFCQFLNQRTNLNPLAGPQKKKISTDDLLLYANWATGLFAIDGCEITRLLFLCLISDKRYGTYRIQLDFFSIR
jgi:hypothetical protein